MRNLKQLASNKVRQIRASLSRSAKKLGNPMADKVRELAQDLSDRGVRANAPYKSVR